MKDSPASNNPASAGEGGSEGIAEHATTQYIGITNPYTANCAGGVVSHSPHFRRPSYWHLWVDGRFPSVPRPQLNGVKGL